MHSSPFRLRILLLFGALVGPTGDIAGESIQCPDGGYLEGVRPVAAPSAPPLDPDVDYPPVRQTCIAERADGRAVVHGPVVDWYPDGSPMCRSEWTWGVQTGTSTCWHVGGSVRLLQHYDSRGVLVSSITYARTDAPVRASGGPVVAVNAGADTAEAPPTSTTNAPGTVARDASPITTTTPDGRAVILRPDGTWTFAPAVAEPPKLAIVLSAVSCENRSVGPYMSIEMGLRNAGVADLGRAHLTFNFLDRRDTIITGGEVYFENVPRGKTLVKRLMAVFYATCEQVGRIDITSAICQEATPQGTERECFAGVSFASGVLTVTK